ncbi:MAG: hypothetical protein EOO82_03975, partial [Oxalobacteraceae bacterium]
MTLSAATRPQTAWLWLVGAAMVAFAALCGLAIGIGLGLPIAALLFALAGLAALLVYFGPRSYRLGANGAFWTSLILSVVLSMLG